MIPGETVSYFLAPFGRVRAELFQESAEIYRALRDLKVVDRYKETPQLGIVSKTWEGARHTRWDYISLTLHLVGALARDTDRKLTSQISIKPGASVSSRRELIQSWALLSHLGHLHWTFMSERALLAEVKGDSEWAVTARQELLNSTPDRDVRAWGELVIDREQVYRFHQLLGFYVIDQLGIEDLTKPLWKSLLAAQAVERESDTQALQQSRDMFRRLRRIAFLTLDSEYSPTIMSNHVFADGATPQRPIRSREAYHRRARLPR
jgi:hypothetical protein